MRKVRKYRTQVNLSEKVVRQIDEAVGRRKRSEFLEKAALAQLRREALKNWMKLGEKFRGLTLEDTYYPSRKELEDRGG
jgi:metal-responsive CopG/Arc/MetJ family transcriptional regulator